MAVSQHPHRFNQLIPLHFTSHNDLTVNTMTRYSLSEESDEDDEEYEPPHPIGFGSRWDRSSLWLRGDGVPSTTYTLDDGENGDEFTFMTRGSFPPLSLYMTKESTPMLLRYRGAQETFHVYQEDDDVLALQELLQRQCMTSPRFIPTPMKELPPNGSMQIAEKIELERRRMEQEHLAMTRGVQLVLNELDRQTAIVLQERKEADEARQEQELAVKKKIQQQEDEARKRKEVEDAKEQAKAESLAKAEQHKRDEQKRHEDAAAAKTEYVAKARKLVAQLVQIRESVQPFDQNKIVSTRRLGMKKLVGYVTSRRCDSSQHMALATTLRPFSCFPPSSDFVCSFYHTTEDGLIHLPKMLKGFDRWRLKLVGGYRTLGRRMNVSRKRYNRNNQAIHRIWHGENDILSIFWLPIHFNGSRPMVSMVLVGMVSRWPTCWPWYRSKIRRSSPFWLLMSTQFVQRLSLHCHQPKIMPLKRN